MWKEIESFVLFFFFSLSPEAQIIFYYKIPFASINASAFVSVPLRIAIF